MAPFDTAFERTIGIEGGYVNNPNDSGGPTKYGITEATARMHGYPYDMQNLTLGNAKSIYRAGYWNLLSLDSISELSIDVALKVFDTGVNVGIGVAGRMFQRLLNVLNRQQRDYPDIVVDGLIGPATRNALRGLISARGPAGVSVLLSGYNALLGAYYIELAERREKDEAFVFGWLTKRVQS